MLALQPGETRARVFPVSYTHLRAHETVLDLVCRLLLEKKTQGTTTTTPVLTAEKNAHKDNKHDIPREDTTSLD